MNKKTLEFQRDLLKKSITLRTKAMYSDDYEEILKLRKEQDETYKKWLFFKKLNSVSKKEQK